MPISPSTGLENGRLSETALRGAWNALGKPFSAVRGFGTKRKAALRAANKDSDFLLNWHEALERVKASSFCRGENDRAWVAGIDWFLRPDKVSEIMEGKFDDRKPKKFKPERDDRDLSDEDFKECFGRERTEEERREARERT